MNIVIKLFQLNYLTQMIRLFNNHCENELVYEPWDELKFKMLFLNHPTFVAINKGKVIGFSSGMYEEKTGVAFITMVFVDKEYRNKGIGTKLLQHLENSLKKEKIKRIDCSFFNPIHLAWNVPNTNKHQHNNAPGVEYPSNAFNLFKHNNYVPIAKENSYYLDIVKYSIPPKIKEKIKVLNERGISFEFFDKQNHHFLNLFDKLGNSQWKEEITKAVFGENPKPVLVPVYNNQAIGFAGPIYPQENLRGYFAGIGIHPDFREIGIGKSLFFLLCQKEKEFGAEYMTLFTGEKNPARRMYEAAGFKLVHSWYVMRKEII